MSKIPNLKREDGSSLYRPFNFEHKIVKCTNPQHVWYPESGALSWQPVAGAKEIWLNCGSCVWCRKQKAREWALRCVHESQYHKASAFITLTYAPEHLPISDNGHPTLVKSDLQKFFKRLRKVLGDVKIRYFAAGEYGEQLARPHYHAIIFGYHFPDKRKLASFRRNAFPLYHSEILSKAWPFGHSSIADFCYESAAYVAGYTAKKIGGSKAASHYDDRVPEFCTMSKGRAGHDPLTGEYLPAGGLGYAYFQDFHEDFYSRDYVVANGITCAVPAYYDRLLKRTNPEWLADLKSARIAKAEEKSAESETGFTFSLERDQLDRTEKARVALFENTLRKYENG